MDSDAYELILDTLNGAYDNVSSGGFIVIDDMHVPVVHRAVSDFMESRGIKKTVLPIPTDYVYGCSVGKLAVGVESEGWKAKRVGSGIMPFVGYWIKD